MRTLAFASIKGGVGKTTLAVHVACAQAAFGKKTLLVDLDPQGHASSMAGTRARTGYALHRRCIWCTTQIQAG